MRRSATPLAQFSWLVAGLLFLPGSPAAWVAVALAAFAAPWIVPLVFAAVRPPREQAWRPYYAALAQDARRALQQMGLAVVLLPDQALLAADAIARTIARVLGSAAPHARMANGIAHGADDGEQQVVRVAPHVAGGVAGRGDVCRSSPGAERSTR